MKSKYSLVHPAMAFFAMIAWITPFSVHAELSANAKTLVKFLKASGDNYEGVADQALTVAAPGVLANDLTAIGTPTISIVAEPSTGSVTINDDGSFTFTPQAGTTGVITFAYRLSVAAVAGNPKISDGLVSITFPDTQGDVAPLVTSPLVAVGHQGTAFSYQITTIGSQPMALDTNGLPGGFTLNTDTITATPGGSGTASVSLIAVNPAGNDLKSLVINIIGKGPRGFLQNPTTAAVGNSDIDTDGDGFSDELETAVGTSTTDANDTPIGTSAANHLRELDLLKMTLKLNFSTPEKDLLIVSGVLPIGGGFDPTAEGLIIDIGGVILAFTLDEKGKGISGNASVKFKFPKEKKVIVAGFAKFKLKVKKLSLVNATGDKLFLDEGMNADQDQKDTPIDVPVTIIFDDQVLINTFTGTYTSKTGKLGKYKFKL